MTDREKIIKIIEKNGTYNGRSFSFDYYVIQPDDLADALIEAGFGYIKELKIELRSKVDYIHEQDDVIEGYKHRAKVVERAFDNIMRTFHELLSAIFLDKKIDLNEWKKDVLTFAERELVEQKGNLERRQKMNNNKDLADTTQCLKYMLGKYNLTDKERQAVDYAFRLLIEKRLSGFDLIKASDIDAGEEVLPCPFCGSTEMVYKKYYDPRHYPFGERWAIFCTGCLAEIDCGWAQKPSAILRLWNRRAKTESNCVEGNKDEADNS